jgi:hypothetical protein
MVQISSIKNCFFLSFGQFGRINYWFNNFRQSISLTVQTLKNEERSVKRRHLQNGTLSTGRTRRIRKNFW